MKSTGIVSIMLNFMLVMIFSQSVFAGQGDTTRVTTHSNVHWSWYANHDAWGVFPPDTVRYEKVLLHYILGCPAAGCSDWDYTTKIEILKHTGQMDSTLNQAPSFKVNGGIMDSV